MPITNLHLLTFVDRLDSIRENLHLRPLTDREVQDIIEAGFTTKTSGVYNPIYSKPKWKNVKERPYKTKRFVIHDITHLTVISTKSRSKKFRLPVLHKFKFSNIQSIQVLYTMISKGFTSLNVTKLCLPRKKKQKLHILLENTGQITSKLNIYTALSSIIHTPISVKIWIERNILSKLGVSIPLESKDSTKISDGSYLYDDVGSISDIEMLELIKDVESIDVIRS